MTNLRQLSFAADRQFSLLRRFLKVRGIPMQLRVRILRYAEHRHRSKNREIQENDVKLIKLLSKPLQHELTRETYAPVLMRHPFFRCYAERDPNAMLRVC